MINGNYLCFSINPSLTVVEVEMHASEHYMEVTLFLRRQLATSSRPYGDSAVGFNRNIYYVIDSHNWYMVPVSDYAVHSLHLNTKAYLYTQ